MDSGQLYRKLAKHVSAIFFSVQSIVLDRAEIGRIGRISRSVIFRRCRKMTENRKCRKIFATLLVLIFAQHGNGGFFNSLYFKETYGGLTTFFFLQHIFVYGHQPKTKELLELFLFLLLFFTLWFISSLKGTKEKKRKKFPQPGFKPGTFRSTVWHSTN